MLQALLSVDELRAWGWRIPFVIGAVTAVVAMYLRRSLAETGVRDAMHSKEAGSLRGLLKHKRAVLLVLGFTAGGSLISTRSPPTCRNTWSTPRTWMPRPRASS